MHYLDTSALMKLVVTEPESDALEAYLRPEYHLVSSAIAITELLRAVGRVQPQSEMQARSVLARVSTINVDERVLVDASAVGPPGLRTLDAIHLASALALGDELEALLTYDARMAEAARSIGIRVEAPGA